MPDSRVTNAAIHGDHIGLVVNVAAFAEGECVEVSGCATQAYEPEGDGGFATFSETQKIGKTNTGEPAILKVRAKLTKGFQDGPDITVFVRVAKVWITVLSQETSSAGSSASTAKPGRMPWASVKGVGGPDDYSSTQGSDGQTAVGAPPSYAAPSAPLA